MYTQNNTTLFPYTTLFRSKKENLMTIEELQLEPKAKAAATFLKNKYPQLNFTSGRRSIFQQAHAMAGNVVLNRDRKSTRLNSSHRCISYAVFCLKKKKRTN